MKIVLQIERGDIDAAIVDWIVKKGYKIEGPIRLLIYSGDGSPGVCLQAGDRMEAVAEVAYQGA